MASFVSPDGYPFDLGVERGGHKIISLLSFSSKTNGIGAELNESQLWLNRGLVWYFGFNHEEAIQCFQKALELGDNPVMAHYGISVCHAPNYNTETMNRDAFPSATDAFQNCKKAVELLANADVRASLSEVEIALVEALPCRFVDPSECDPAEPVEQNTDAYAETMRLVHERFPEDPNVGCLYAESLMNKSPWQMWDLNTGEPTSQAVIAQDLLVKGLKIAPNHPGLNHFMIHLMEMSPHPEVSLPSCAVLRKYFPSVGHLIHMPSHIYVLLGMWQEAADANIEAWAVDDVYVKKEGIFNYYTGYRIHNLHFISYASMFAGRFDEAMKGALEINRNLPDSLLENPIMNKFFESFLSIEVHVLLRFGRWAEILAKPIPTNDKIHRYLIATFHYARGIAHAVLGDTVAAAAELALLRASAPKVPADHVLHNNLCSDMLAVAEHMLLGELAYRQGKYEEGFWELGMAVELSDNLVYDEPWGWMQPPIHALGALTLEQGHVARAEKCFRKDMDTSYYGRCHPDNIWALKGLEQCLIRMPVLPSDTSAASASAVSTNGSAAAGAKSNGCKCKGNGSNSAGATGDSETKGTADTPAAGSAQARVQELVQVRAKIAALEKRSDCVVKVACMCATKGL